MTQNKPIPLDSNPVSVVSHKLRTPLTVLMSTVNNLLDGAYGDLNSDQKIWIKKMETHTAKLESLLNEILDLLKTQLHQAPVGQEAQPALKEKAVPLANASASDKKGAPKRTEKIPKILIVDDEPDILDVVQEGMSSKGFETFTAKNGDEAVQKSLEIHPDLILMDVLLEHQNGMDVCRKIKSELKSFTPVILVTGQNDLREKISGAPHEADDLLTKPFQMEELFARVMSMLRMKQLYDQVQTLKGQQS